MSTEEKYNGIKFEDYLPQFNEFLNVLKEAKCFDNVLIIGSWAEYLYEQTNYLQDFHPPMGTKDLDLFIRNIRMPEQEKSIAECAHAHGFLSRVDYDSQINMFVGNDEFEVEFLVGANWKEIDESRWQPMSELGIRATAKPDMWPMNDFFTTVRYNGINVHIPEPEAYFTHKILINNTRGEKSISDRQKINHILPYLDKDRLADILSRCHKSEMSRIDRYFAGQLGYPNSEYFLNDGKTASVSQDKRDVIIQGAKELLQSIDSYSLAKDHSSDKKAEKSVETARKIKNLTISSVYERFIKTGLSKDDYWMILKQAGLTNQRIEAISAAFKQAAVQKEKAHTKPQNPATLLKDDKQKAQYALSKETGRQMLAFAKYIKQGPEREQSEQKNTPTSPSSNEDR